MMRETASILPLEARDLAFCVGAQALLSGVSFRIEAGGAAIVLGPNGAGKSLLLRLCHGLLRPSQGSVEWAARGGVIAGRKRHAMVFQKPVMLRRSARANLLHAISAAGGDAAQGGQQEGSQDSAQQRAQEALERFGLADLAERPARLLSGGEQQRLAIARAWALRPQVLFLDEPCSQLDPGATRQVEAMLTTLRAEGVTLVMTTHDLGQARRLASRILFLNRGALLEDAPAATFFAHQESAEARAFVQGDLLW